MSSSSNNNSSSVVSTAANPAANIIDLTGSEDDSEMADVPETAPTARAALKLHIDTTDVNLSAADVAELEGMKARWEQMLMQCRKGPFRIMDLPPELRLRILGLAVGENAAAGIYNFANFKMPSITRASKQLRQEALSAFFSENAFTVSVKSNFRDRWLFRRRDPAAMAIAKIESDQKTAGVTRMRQPLRNIVTQAGPAAILREITFKIISTRYIANGKDSIVTSFVTFKHTKGALRYTIRNGLMHPAFLGFAFPPDEQQDIDAALKALTDKAEEIGSRAGFNGITIGHVDELALALRFRFPGRT